SILNGTEVPIAATCNWFGSVDGAIITSRVSAGVQYIPWLTDGTDAEPGTLGFQPLPDVCNGEQINFYVNDNSTTDDTFTTAVGNDNNPGTSEAPFATIQKAVQLASEGTSIYVDAGSYVEQVTIGKGLTITCAARSKSFVTLPATTAPAPGPFMEQGTFQTTQDIGDVHLSGLSITGDLARSITPVIIQGGGSVRNSNLQGGNQGVFFRVETAAKTAEVESNIIQAEYIGVNFEGQAITASLLNNAIAVNNTGFSAGVFANGGGTFTATGNSISNYATAGISGGSTTNINNNSFAGAGGFAIQTYSTANATCNWFGTADEAAITAQLSGNVSFAPWLTNGTDADPGSIGFQPLNGVCNGGIVVLTVVLNSKQDVLCAGDAAGTINVTVSGGEAPYSYSWTKTGDAGYGADTEDLQNLTAGTYNLTVTDALDATANLAVTITQPALLLGNVSGTNVTCFNAADGTAMMNVSGGTSPYTYLWSTSAETAGISGLAPGTYSVTATDANGCTVAGSYTVTQPPALVPAVVVVNNTCATGTNGSLTVSANGGTAPYTYSLDGVNYQPGNVFSNLAAGNYMVYVQDAAGCIASANATLTAPPAIVIVPTSVTGTCAGTSNGNVDVTISGGTGRYSFAWTGPNGFTFNREDLTRVAAGTYTLVVTDANGCTATLAVEVVATPALVITGDLTPVPCFGTSTGAIDVRVSGGSGSGYTFVWSGPNGFKAATEDVSGLRAGSYTVTVTDAGGCSAAQAFTVSQPAAALTLPPPVRTDIAACDALGSITANATGGTAPYQYSLNGGALQLSNVFTNLPAANYSIQATDANGCTSALVNVSIVDNGTDAFEANNTVSAASNINIGQRIRARLAATKGADQDWYRFVTTATGSYAVSWTHPSVLQTFDLYVLNRNKAVLVTPTSVVGNTKNYANLAANTYHVQVNGTQSFVCYDLVVNSLSAPLLITSAPAVGNQAKSINGDEQPLSATAFPNPHRGSFTLRIESQVHGEGQVTLYDLTGRALTERKVLLQQGANTVRFDGQRPVGMVYRVMVDGKVVTGKVIGMY
ncbi:MAG TPA: DUF1565 domain-containing protein, partial [Phnomibacter sp.]|nr:DUF1565 domain-containing protein [Phnomibacter sp.]